MNDSNKYKIWELAASKIHLEAGDRENQELDELLQQPENQKIFADVHQVHKEIPEVRPLYNSSSSRSWQIISRYFKNKKTKLYLNIAKYAAIIILAFGIGTFFHFNLKPQPEIPPVYTEIFVPPGQMSEITLNDGTHVWLNSETTLRYADNFGKDARNSELKGEAYFKVKRSEIPFKVGVKDNEVEVLGTSFGVIAYPDENFSRVTLVEGSVQINDNHGRTLKQLIPKQQINLPDDKSKKITTTMVDTGFYESWILGEIKFDDEQLNEVARRIERWYNVEIRFASTDMQAMRFTGTVLKEKPVDQSVAAICKLLALKADYKSNPDTKDVIIISKK